MYCIENFHRKQGKIGLYLDTYGGIVLCVCVSVCVRMCMSLCFIMFARYLCDILMCEELFQGHVS